MKRRHNHKKMVEYLPREIVDVIFNSFYRMRFESKAGNMVADVDMNRTCAVAACFLARVYWHRTHNELDELHAHAAVLLAGKILDDEFRFAICGNDPKLNDMERVRVGENIKFGDLGLYAAKHMIDTKALLKRERRMFRVVIDFCNFKGLEIEIADNCIKIMDAISPVSFSVAATPLTPLPSDPPPLSPCQSDEGTTTENMEVETDLSAV